MFWYVIYKLNNSKGDYSQAGNLDAKPHFSELSWIFHSENHGFLNVWETILSSGNQQCSFLLV